MEIIIKWLESHMQPCYYKKLLGFDCPGCGMQRAFIELLKGNIWESVLNYPALMSILFMLIYLSFHLIFDFKNGAKILKLSFIFNVIVILLNCIAKLF